MTISVPDQEIYHSMPFEDIQSNFKRVYDYQQQGKKEVDGNFWGSTRPGKNKALLFSPFNIKEFAKPFELTERVYFITKRKTIFIGSLFATMEGFVFEYTEEFKKISKEIKDSRNWHHPKS